VSDSRRSRTAVFAWGAIVVIILGVVGLVTYALTHVSTPATVTQTALTSPAVLAAVSTVPPATFDAVGVSVSGVDLTAPRVVAGQRQLTSGGLPEVLAVGAEYCPFCAAERWPLVVALARFGHFTVLHDATSSAQSVFPGTPTFSFDGVRYTSRYLALTGIELFSDQIGPDGTFIRIARLSPAESALVASFTGDPGSGSGSAPFVDVAGRMVATTSAFSPALLAGLSQSQVADDVAKPTATSGTAPSGTGPALPVGQAILAAANQLTAGMCAATAQQPAAVCRSRGVRTADQALGLAPPPPISGD
jgi:hypothetical protein